MIKTKNNINEEALSVINPLNNAGLAITTGGGKTLIGLKHFQNLIYKNKNLFTPKALVVAPKKSIINSWKDEAEKFDLDFILEHITFTTYLSLNKKNPHDYDVIYLDECHSLLYKHEIFLKKYENIIIGLTGTPPKSIYSEKGKLVNKYCPIVYSYITDEAVNDKILNDYKIYVHLLELEDINTINVKVGNRQWKTSEQKQYNYWTNKYIEADNPKSRQIASIMRMKAMQTFPSKEQYAKLMLNESKNKCILFANEQLQADKLCKYSYHSKNPDSELNLNNFKEGKINKLSCVLQLSEGVNIPNLKEGIIMHAYGNNRKSAQRIGRLLRLNPDDKAIIHILCYKSTIDEKWIKDALSELNQDKISYYDPYEF